MRNMIRLMLIELGVGRWCQCWVRVKNDSRVISICYFVHCIFQRLIVLWEFSDSKLCKYSSFAFELWTSLNLSPTYYKLICVICVPLCSLFLSDWLVIFCDNRSSELFDGLFFCFFPFLLIPFSSFITGTGEKVFRVHQFPNLSMGKQRSGCRSSCWWRWIKWWRGQQMYVK